MPSFLHLARLLKCCDARSGKCVHAHALKTGLLTCHCVSKPLLNVYANCGHLHDSWRLFAQIGNPSDPVPWNTLIMYSLYEL